ncbi:MAG: DUF547 domain-containing protein [bacterium]
MKTLLALLLLLPAVTQAQDVAAWDALLKANVKDGKVNYEGFKDNADFKAFVAAVGTTDPATLPSDDARLAFWINAYNALTISGVLAAWPGITSVSTVKPDFAFFKDKDYTVGGKKLALNDIENEIIRPTFKDPRVHAALNCASISCPPLQPFAFTAEKVRDQLQTAMAAFVLDRSRNQIDAAAKTVKLSSIFDWYKADFEAAGGVKAYLKGFLKDDAEKAALDAANLEFGTYDWNLNKL